MRGQVISQTFRGASVDLVVAVGGDRLTVTMPASASPGAPGDDVWLAFDAEQLWCLPNGDAASLASYLAGFGSMRPSLAVQGGLTGSHPWARPVQGRSVQDRMLIGSALVLLASYLLPLAGVVALSFLVPAPGIGNYWALLHNSTVRSVVGNTLWISTLTVAITLLLAYVTAYGLVQARPFARQLMLACVLLPLWISVLVRNYAWIALLSPSSWAILDVGQPCSRRRQISSQRSRRAAFRSTPVQGRAAAWNWRSSRACADAMICTAAATL
ncbi:TOBE domain-containing protein [Bradyrhizobium neotropicale]|uniref:TOBE domain-containing protein n=1 Tax=Bradyrhizobium neotropicale TaxID=1497615 RepID=UPI003907EE15